jgi:hypothetical protein
MNGLSVLIAALLSQTVVYEPKATPAQKAAAEAAAAAEIAAENAKVAANPYDADADAEAQLSGAIARATIGNKRVVIVMGANWCHDSRDLAKWMHSSRFRDMLTPQYEVVFIDVGIPQTGKGRNLQIAKRYGIKKMKKTPLVLVVTPAGKRLNSKKDAIGWNNASSRNEDDVFGYFAQFTPT